MRRAQDGQKHVCVGKSSCNDVVMFVVFNKNSLFVHLELSPLRKYAVCLFVCFINL